MNVMPTLRMGSFLLVSLYRWLRPRLVSRAALATTAFLLASCSYGVILTQDAMDYNRAYEDYSNKQLLLNAVRASFHYPMKFTDFKQIQGNLSVTTGANFSIPFSKPDAAANNANPSVSIRKSPSFDMDIQSRNADFIKGVLSPIEPATFEYFITQGWDARHTFLLFGERLEISQKYTLSAGTTHSELRKKQCATSLHNDELCFCSPDTGDSTNNKGSCTYVFKNNPDTHYLRDVNPSFHEACEAKVHHIIGSDEEDKRKKGVMLNRQICDFLDAASTIDIASIIETTKTPVGPSFSDTVEGLGMMEQIIAASSAKLLTGCTEKTNGDAPNNTDASGIAICSGKMNDYRLYSETKKIKLNFPTPWPKHHDILGSSSSVADTIEAIPKKDRTVTLVLRSPQSILFYLGELITMQRKFRRSICFGEQGTPSVRDSSCSPKREHDSEIVTERFSNLFRVANSSVPMELHHVMTKFNGHYYHIPRRNAGTSLSTLGIVDYLIGLHQGESDRPLTSRVRIVGQ